MPQRPLRRSLAILGGGALLAGGLAAVPVVPLAANAAASPRVSAPRAHGPAVLVTPVPAPGPSLQIGGLRDGYFGRPQGVALDAAGNLFVADHENRRIQEFDPQGHFINKWSTAIDPLALTISPKLVNSVLEPVVYVAGQNGGGDSDGILEYDESGNLLAHFGGTGAAFLNIAVDVQGNVYAVEGSHGNANKFSPAGAPLVGQFGGSQGNAAVATDASHVYITTCLSGGDTRTALQIFNFDGTLAGGWGTASQFNCAYGLAVEPNGTVHIADTNNDHVLAFSNDGKTMLYQVGSLGQAAGQFYFPVGLAVDAQSRTYVADTSNSRIQFLDTAGSFVLSFGKSTLYSFYNALAFSPAPNGEIYIADYPTGGGGPNARISAFDMSGNLLLRREFYYILPNHGSGLPAPTSLAVDAAGQIFVDFGGIFPNSCAHPLIVKFDAQFNFVTDFSDPFCEGMVGPSLFDQMAFDSSGFLYLVSGSQVTRLNTNLAVVNTIALTSFTASPSVAVDPQGIIYLGGDGGSVRGIFDSSGNTIGVLNGAPSHFLAISPDRALFAADTVGATVSAFPSVSATAQIIWNLPYTPIGLAVDSSRVWLAAQGSRIAGGQSVSASILNYPDLFLSSITPTVAPNTAAVSAVVRGRGIASGATVRLSQAGQPDRVASTATASPDGTSVSFTVDLTAAATGTWNVTVTNPDGFSTSLVGAFTVAAAGSPLMWADISGFNIFVNGYPSPQTLFVGNSGTADAPPGLIEVAVPLGLHVTFPSNAVVHGLGDAGLTFRESPYRVMPVFVPSIAAHSSVDLPFSVTAPAGWIGDYQIRVAGAWAPLDPTLLTPVDPKLTLGTDITQLTSSEVAATIHVSNGSGVVGDLTLNMVLAPVSEVTSVSYDDTVSNSVETISSAEVVPGALVGPAQASLGTSGRLASTAAVGVAFVKVSSVLSGATQTWNVVSSASGIKQTAELWRLSNLLSKQTDWLKECLPVDHDSFGVPLDSEYNALHSAALAVKLKAVAYAAFNIATLPAPLLESLLLSPFGNLIASGADAQWKQEIQLIVGMTLSDQPQVNMWGLQPNSQRCKDLIADLKKLAALGGTSRSNCLTSQFEPAPASPGDNLAGLYVTFRNNVVNCPDPLMVEFLLDQRYMQQNPPPPPPPPPAKPPPPPCYLVSAPPPDQCYLVAAPRQQVSTKDPNGIFGPSGAGQGRWIPPSESLGYTVAFENQPSATASVQKLAVTVPLDPSTMDLTNFTVGPITLGSLAAIPPAGLTSWSATLDLRPALPIEVQLQAGLDSTTNVARWQLQAIDPNTGQPPADPTIGFLPPDSSPPGGEGTVSFTIGQRPGLPTGTSLSAGASVVFDQNAAIATQTWTNRVDADAPVTHVSALPTVSQPSGFPVTWSGTDNGSGIAMFTILVSDNGGSWTTWIQSTATAATFVGLAGHTYAFISQGTDGVGNVEPMHAIADASTRVGTPTTTAVASSAEPSVFGQAVTLTATVSPVPDGGLVQFSVDGAPAGSPIPVNTVTGEASSAPIASLSVGTHSISATYSGHATFLSSSANLLTQAVKKADTSTTLSGSISPLLFGHPVTFTAAVGAQPPGAGSPGGTVQFEIDGKNFGDRVALVGGVASSPSMSSLLPGAHAIVAIYSGDSNFNGSASTLTVAVTCTTTLISSVRGGLTVPAGSSACSATNGIAVNGGITVQAGGALYLSGVTVHGGISSNGATEIAVCKSTVDGATTVSGSSGYALLGDGSEDGCAGNTLHGGLTLTGNQGGFELSGNTVAGSVTVMANATGSGARTEDGGLAMNVVEGNSITGRLSCSTNNPAATNEGGANVSGGGETGECATAGF